MSSLFADRLSGLDVPADAQLVGLTTSTLPDGAREWHVTFRIDAPDAKAKRQPHRPPLPPAVPRPDGIPPPPPPLAYEQLGLSPAEAAAATTAAATTATVAPTATPTATAAAVATPPRGAIQDSPVPGPFPLLPFQEGSANRLFPLRCSVMTYAWGQIANNSLVARLACHDPDFELEDKVPYAEMWMGTHPSGPSMVMLESPWRIITPLSDWLKLNPSLRKPTRGKPPNHLRPDPHHGLPFLFKVLSVRTALSIQAHPDKTLAAQLHAEKPAYYKDDNHKPEMALAVTHFEALCSFQKINSVLENLRACPELVGIVGEEVVAKLQAASEKVAPLTPAWPPQRWGRRACLTSAPTSSKSAAPSPHGKSEEEVRFERAEFVVPVLKEVFTRLMTADAALVEQQLNSLMNRIAMTAPMLRAPIDELAARLHEQYPHDVGVFCAYLLNYLVLEPGEALFLAANEPHAYIFGDCIECMATSDNVIRAGLTPKFKDVDVLCASLTYDDGPPHMVAGFEIAHNVFRYVTPVPEFLVDRIEVPLCSTTKLPPSPFTSILIVLQGSGTTEEMIYGEAGTTGLVHEVQFGSVFMLACDTLLLIRTSARSDGPLLIFRATPRYELDEAYQETQF